MKVDPALGDPAYDTPVLEDREVSKRRKKKDALDVALEDGTPVADVADAAEKGDREPRARASASRSSTGAPAARPP